MKIPNKSELKLLKFCDNTNLIPINQKSIIVIINFLKKYEKVSGARININKTTITPLANAKIYNLQNNIEDFRITKNNELFKILGLYFSKILQNGSECN